MKVFKEIWKLAWPVMLVSSLNTLFSIVDLKFISMLGTQETAGAVLATSVYGVIMVLSGFISAGTLAIASRSIGAGRNDEFVDVSRQSIAYALFFGIGAYILALLLKTPLLNIFGVTEDVYAYTVQYLNIIYLTIPVNFIMMVLVSILHAKGDTKTPMMAFVSANAINLVMDPILIFGVGGYLKFGITGAALATLFGQIFSTIFLLNYVLKMLNYSLADYIKSMSLKTGMLKRIIRIGSYSVLYGITRPFTGLLMYKIAAESGEEAIAAFGIGGRMFSILLIFLSGLEVAISILVGQSLGSRDMDRISLLIKEGIKVAFINIAVLAVPYAILSKYLMLAFSKDPIVIDMGVRYLRIVYVGLVFLALTTVFNAVFKGAGENRPPMIGAMVANWLVKIPLAYWLGRSYLKSDGVWVAIAISVAAEALVAWYYFRQGKWKTKEV